MTRRLNWFQRVLCWFNLCPWTVAKSRDRDAQGRFPWFCQRCHKYEWRDPK